MINYTDYNFYKNTYHGNIPEENFNKLVIRASVEVQNRIFNRDITEFEEVVQMATCSVVDILYKIEQLENKKEKITSEKNLKSETVANYSRTFENSSLSDIQQEITKQKAKIREEITLYLLGTGLLYRGV